MKRKRIYYAALTSFTSLACAVTAWSQVPLSVTNPSFEDPIIGDGDHSGVTLGAPAGWSGGFYEVPNLTDWVPETLDYRGAFNPGLSDFGGVAPDGDNVAYAESYTGYLVGLNQVLTDTLLPGLTYDLSVEVGNPGGINAGGSAPDYRIELLAGSTKIMEVEAASPATDTFATVNLPSYVAPGAGDPLIGQALEIRLMAADNTTNALEVHFDEVSLTRSALLVAIADAGGPYSVPSSGSLSLDGSNSLPSDGQSITLWEWDLNNDGTYGDTTGATPAAISNSDLMTMWGMVVGSNTIGLRVTDDSLPTPKTATSTTTVVLSTNAFVSTATVVSSDTWNQPANWDTGVVPSGAEAAIISAGLTATANASPTYSEGLTLQAGSELNIRNLTGAGNAIGTGTVTFNTGSTLRLSTGENNITIPGDIVLAGDALIFNSSNATDNEQRFLTGDISGTGQLTYSMRRGNILHLDGTNSWSGGFIANFVDNNFGNASRVQPGNSGLGTGDVTLNDGITLEILGGLGDTIDDAAALSLNGRGRSNQKLILGSDETVGFLNLNGFSVSAGDYASTSGLVDSIGSQLIHGSGTLTVLGDIADTTAPTVVSIDDPVGGSDIYENFPFPLVYTVTFDDDIDGTTVTAADFDNAGTASISIGAVTKLTGPFQEAEFSVEVTATTTGTIQLRIPSGADITDLGGNPLAVPVLDDATITVLAGNAPDTTISGTASGSNSWNDPSNWDFGVPRGPQNAFIAAGITAQTNSTSTPDYDGTLTLLPGAELRFVDNGSEDQGVFNALGNGGLIMSTATVNSATRADPTYPDIELLLGDSLFYSSSNTGDRDTRTFGGVISGSGSLTVRGRNVEKYVFTQTNTFSGGVTFDAVDRYIVRAQATGAFGAGDVTVVPRTNADMRSAVLSIEAPDVIADTATLTLAGKGGNNTGGFDDFSGNSVLIRMNFDDTVNALFLDGVQLPAGAYTSASGDWIDGVGTLTVLNPSVGGSAYDTWAAANGLTGGPGSATDPAVGADGDGGGKTNLFEFGFNGDPLQANNEGLLFSLIADSDVDADTDPELLFTIAVRTDTVFTAGLPATSAAVDGIIYTVGGDIDLNAFNDDTQVNVATTAVVPAGAPDLSGNPDYEYVTLSLDGSTGTLPVGFMRASVAEAP